MGGKNLTPQIQSRLESELDEAKEELREAKKAAKEKKEKAAENKKVAATIFFGIPLGLICLLGFVVFTDFISCSSAGWGILLGLTIFGIIGLVRVVVVGKKEKKSTSVLDTDEEDLI